MRAPVKWGDIAAALWVAAPLTALTALTLDALLAYLFGCALYRRPRRARERVIVKDRAAVKRCLDSSTARTWSGMPEQDKVELDVALYGTGFLVGGKRVDPRTVVRITAPRAVTRDLGVVRLYLRGATWPRVEEHEREEYAREILARMDLLRRSTRAAACPVHGHEEEESGACVECDALRCLEAVDDPVMKRPDAKTEEPPDPPYKPEIIGGP